MKQNPTSPIQRKTTTPPFLIAIALVLGCFALLPTMQAVVPAPDGGYPGFNTAEGQNALLHLTTGTANTALGWLSLENVTAGSFNTGVGAGTLVLNSGDQNTATGAAALLLNTTGNFNTANGALALFSNTTGDFNTANGMNALFSNTEGYRNTANGQLALFSNTTGDFNTASGMNALVNNTTGSFNVGIGTGSGFNVSTASNVICIGTSGSNLDNSCFIGHIYSNVQPIVGTDPDSVTITSNGRLGRGNVSSRRYKHDIKPMGDSSEALYALKPVSFRYNREYDATQTPAFGLIAEEVAEVIPDLVGRNFDGQPESVRYEQINAMLLNEFLKEHRKNEQQESQIEQQDAKIARQQQQIEELTVGLQKVSAQLELSKAAPQTVLNNQ
jgi:hypothetical protein